MMQKKRDKKITPIKSNATLKYNAGKISRKERELIHKNVDKNLKEIKDYKRHYQSKLKTIKGSGLRRGQRGRQLGKGAYFLMMQKKCYKS